MSTASEIVDLLPRVIRHRFERLASFVNAALEEHDPNYRKRLTQGQLEFLQLLSLAYTLDRFFRDGTRAALGAAQLFRELGAEGFSVGREVFTPDSESTMRGESLANALRSALQETPYLGLIDTSRSLRAFVLGASREVRRDRTLG